MNGETGCSGARAFELLNPDSSLQPSRQYVMVEIVSPEFLARQLDRVLKMMGFILAFQVAILFLALRD